MKMTRFLTLIVRPGLLLALCASWALQAQEAPPPPPPDTPPAEEKAAPTEDRAMPADTPAAPVEAEEAGEAPLRRLDQGDEQPQPTPTEDKSGGRNPRERTGRSIVTQGSDATLDPGEEADDVVAVFGDAFSHGRATGDVVAVFGDATVTGETGGEVVAVFGNVEINGPVAGDVVAVLGGVTLGPDARVKGEVVSIGGKLNKHPSAKIGRGVQEVGAFFDLDQLDGLKSWFRRALVLGRPLAFGPNLGWAWTIAGLFLGFYVLLGLAFGRGVQKCAETLEQRPGDTILASFLTLLATPVLLVVLAITGVGPFLLLFALLFASLFGKAAFLTWIGRRIAKPLGVNVPVVATLIGGLIVLALYVVPVLGALVWALGGAIGLGMAVYTLILSIRREKPAAPPLPPAATLGSTDVAYAATSGVATTSPSEAASVVPGQTTMAGETTPAADFGVGAPGSTQRQNQSAGYLGSGATDATGAGVAADVASAASIGGAPGGASGVAGAASAGTSGSGGPGVASGPGVSTTFPASASASAPPLLRRPAPVVSALSLPRVGFWLRLAAAALDAVLVGVVAGMVGIDGFFPLLYAVYCVVLWTLKGTTVGGIICGLKLVRIDDRKIDWSIAVVRALGGFLSLAVAGLGFIWVSFDDDRQAWHDKIAGTTIVRVPRGVPLV